MQNIMSACSEKKLTFVLRAMELKDFPKNKKLAKKMCLEIITLV